MIAVLEEFVCLGDLSHPHPSAACAVKPAVVVNIYQMFLLFCVMRRRSLGQKGGREGTLRNIFSFSTLILIVSHHSISQGGSGHPMLQWQLLFKNQTAPFTMAQRLWKGWVAVATAQESSLYLPKSSCHCAVTSSQPFRDSSIMGLKLVWFGFCLAFTGFLFPFPEAASVACAEVRAVALRSPCRTKVFMVHSARHPSALRTSLIEIQWGDVIWGFLVAPYPPLWHFLQGNKQHVLRLLILIKNGLQRVWHLKAIQTLNCSS